MIAELTTASAIVYGGYKTTGAAIRAAKQRIIAFRAAQGVGISPNIPRIANRGNTGRTAPLNLNEQLAMAEVKSNPLSGARQILSELGDPRWPAN